MPSAPVQARTEASNTRREQADCENAHFENSEEEEDPRFDKKRRDLAKIDPHSKPWYERARQSAEQDDTSLFDD